MTAGKRVHIGLRSISEQKVYKLVQIASGDLRLLKTRMLSPLQVEVGAILKSNTSTARVLTQWTADDRGAVAIVFALCLVCLLGVTAMAIEFGSAVSARSKAQTAADAAVLAAVKTAKDYLTSNAWADTGIATEKAIAAAAKYFGNDVLGSSGTSRTPTIRVSIVNGVINAQVAYSASLHLNFGAVIGMRNLGIGVSASASSRTMPFVEVTLLIDTSGSMALGASAADQSRLIAQTGCAFACHDGVPVLGYADAYAYAKANNITLRYDAVNQGILALSSKIDELDPSHQFISVSVYSFNNALTTNLVATTDTNRVRVNLPTSPVTSSMTAGATHFNEIIDLVSTAMGSGGDGSSAANPIKLLIIATDGAQDPGRYWTSDVPARDKVGAFDMSFCGPLKSRGNNVGIIHTPYLPMTYDWGYMATLGQPSQIGGGGTRADDIPTVLRDCAEGLYLRADDTAGIASGFVSIFTAMTSVRLIQ